MSSCLRPGSLKFRAMVSGEFRANCSNSVIRKKTGGLGVVMQYQCLKAGFPSLIESHAVHPCATWACSCGAGFLGYLLREFLSIRGPLNLPQSCQSSMMKTTILHQFTSRL